MLFMLAGNPISSVKSDHSETVLTCAPVSLSFQDLTVMDSLSACMHFGLARHMLQAML